MNTFFQNKVVWITGASSGIGEALGKEFSKRGAKLILSARNATELERVKQQCNGGAENIFVLPLDLRNSNELDSKTQEALEKWGVVDFLVLNAGIAAREYVENTDMAIYREVMETNYFAPVALTRGVLPAMIASGSGHIVAISSLSGKYGVPKLSAYSSSKHALHGFFDSLRAEVFNKNIKISLLIPGFINTAILKRALDGKGNAHGRNLKVNEKGLSPERCALKIIEAIKDGKEEALIGGVETASVLINRLFPVTFRKIVRNHPVRKMTWLKKLFKKNS